MRGLAVAADCLDLANSGSFRLDLSRLDSLRSGSYG